MSELVRLFHSAGIGQVALGVIATIYVLDRSHFFLRRRNGNAPENQIVHSIEKMGDNFQSSTERLGDRIEGGLDRQTDLLVHIKEGLAVHRSRMEHNE